VAYPTSFHLVLGLSNSALSAQYGTFTVTTALTTITLTNVTQGHFSHSALLQYFGYSIVTVANNTIQGKDS